MARLAPYTSRFAPSGMVCAVDHLAAEAGIEVLRAGGSAADAAVAASAVLAVTCPHMCGMGGDLFALVHPPGATRPWALNASGRSGSGADPERLRAEGHEQMPPMGDIRTVPVPGCVDGWLALHARFGRLALADVLASAIHYAVDGFPASPLLAATAPFVADVRGGENLHAATRPGAMVRRPATGRALQAIVAEGRSGFYGGAFGRGLLRLGGGEYTGPDLEAADAAWVDPLEIEAWGQRIWTVPPNSQGYLTLAGAWIAAGLPLPDDSDNPAWAHLTIESARQAAYDRPEVLHEHANGAGLIAPERLGPRRDAIDFDQAAVLDDTAAPGGTIFLCAIDASRQGVSLIQSNAAGFGAHLVEPETGTFLHNRGIGFNLVPGHPAEYGPRRRPPHTLSPALVTDRAGRLRMVIGTMGGDSQPQILLQLLARLVPGGESVGDAIAAPRWTLQSLSHAGAFHTWGARGRVEVALEPGCPPGWAAGLSQRGHRVTVAPGNYGHAHAIACHDDHLEGASDPRSLAGGAVGY
jgi:gamma-glutamyltranspeptidase/glutathione hydrolase